MADKASDSSKSTDADNPVIPKSSGGKPMGMLPKVLLAVFGLLAAVVVVFLIVVAVQPSQYRVERSTTIDAPPEEVFAHVNDFHQWEAWSPWAERDPNAVAIYEGPDAGEGAIFKWSGNDDVGEGSMTITESKPHERIGIDLAFVRPMEDACDVEFIFEPQGDGTKVNWAMFGENNFVGKAFCLFMDMDAMVGKDFEQGLASMKKAVEGEAGK